MVVGGLGSWANREGIGSCTNDGGCGCAAALGAAFYRADGSTFVPVGADLDQICRIDLTDCRRRLAQ